MKRAQHAAHNPKFDKMGLSPVVAKNILKDPSTRLNVVTTLEKPPTPTHITMQKFLPLCIAQRVDSLYIWNYD